MSRTDDIRALTKRGWKSDASREIWWKPDKPEEEYSFDEAVFVMDEEIQAEEDYWAES